MKPQVLIVPLWNWNGGEAIFKETQIGSNRTFMELKWRCCSASMYRFSSF